MKYLGCIQKDNGIAYTRASNLLAEQLRGVVHSETYVSSCSLDIVHGDKTTTIILDVSRSPNNRIAINNQWFFEIPEYDVVYVCQTYARQMIGEIQWTTK